MSKPISRRKGDPYGPQSGSSESGHKGLVIIVLLCFLGIMPILVWVSIPEASPYTTVTTSNAMVQSAVAAAGLQVCTQTAVNVEVSGAQSAVLYQISPDCSIQIPSTLVQVLVIGFSSTDAQNAAIAEAQVTHKNWQTTNTAAFTSGYNVIVVQGEPGNKAVQDISTALIEQGAIRII